MAATLDTGMRTARRHLARKDPALGAWIRRIGPVDPRRQSSHFSALLRSIISQQLSSKAAATVCRRVMELCERPRHPRPREILELTDAELRAAGASRAKVVYLKEIARAFETGHLRNYRFSTRTDERIVEDLCRIKGVGQWTAEMFLIFALRRPDVFSPGDLALRNAIERVDGRPMTPAGCSERAEVWRPWRSVACLYLWKIAHWGE